MRTQISQIPRTVWLMIALYIIIFGLFTSFRHYNFLTQTWDLGVFVQSFSNTLDGRWMQNNIEDAPHHFGVHMSPWLLALVPGYFLFPSPYFLLIIQTIALGLGAWPLYLLAKEKLNHKWALAISGAYLLYPSLHWVNTFDFHSVPFLVPFLLASFYLLEKQRYGWMTFFLVLSASTREDSILVVLFFGLYMLVRTWPKEKFELTKERKIGLAVAVLALIYFILAAAVFMPAYGGGLLRLDRYEELGGTAPGIIKAFFTEPALFWGLIFTKPKILYLLWLFLPVMFLPFLSWRSMLLLVPGIMENILTSYSIQFSGLYQYDSTLIAGIFIGVITGIGILRNKYPQKEKHILIAYLFFVLLGYLARSPLNPIFFPTEAFRTTPHTESFRKIVNAIPDNISVTAHTNLVPHLSHRQHIYELGHEPFPTGLVILDGKDNFGFGDNETFVEYIQNYADLGY
ncbi:MAG: DUF2079 domain-containing protein, partial [bacterium]|nr:DUF2079 domain-containing protein [bacterium]